MATYLILGKLTTQGIQHINETTKRANRFKEIAMECGVKVKEIYWLMGEYDVVNIVEAPDDESLAALLVRVGAWGNVATTTFRAFNHDEMDGILKKSVAS